MPANYSTNIVYLSKAQYQELLTNQTITVNGTTVTYNDNDIYVTPQAEPVTDVQVNGTSIVTDGVANVPKASSNNLGVIGINPGWLGFNVNANGLLYNEVAPDNQFKMGTDGYRPVIINKQHMSAFYGLAKAAGHDEKDSTEPLGTYTDGAKAAIQNMLGITDLISTEESSTATAAHALNSTFMMGGKLYKATAAIAVGDAVEVGTNCEVVKADEVFVKKTDYASTSVPGVVKVSSNNGTQIINGVITTYNASDAEIKAGNSGYKILNANNQHKSVFYGLAKAAGADEKDSTLSIGTYTETAKSAIRTMIGATSPNVIAVQDEQPTDADTKVWLPETEAQGIQVPTYEEFQVLDNNTVKKTDYASSTTAGIVKVASSHGAYIVNDGDLYVSIAYNEAIKMGASASAFITPYYQHYSAFYGLAKAAGDTTQSASSNAVGTYTDEAKAAIKTMLGVSDPTVTDVQIDGTSILSDGVANVPIMSALAFGVAKVNPAFGVAVNSNGFLESVRQNTNLAKSGTDNMRPVVSSTQHESTFYGLAKAAGDTTQSASDNPVGTYTDEAKLAIQTMFGIDLQSIASEVEIPLIETVEGTTPTITGQPNTRYVCGEVSTISITPPSAGSIDVIFESGSTAAVLTVPNTVKWPAWFDATTLEADTIYEILITDGVYGSVMTWAN